MRDRAAEMWGDALRGAACRLTGPGCSPHSLAPLSPKASPSVCWSSVTRTQPQRPPRPQGNPGKPRAAGAPPWGGEKGSRGGARGEPASPRPPRSSRPESRPPTRPACSSLIYPARPGRGAWGEGEAGHPHPPHTHTHPELWSIRVWSAPLAPSRLSLPRSLTISKPLFHVCFSLFSGFPVPGGTRWVQEPRGERHNPCPFERPQRGPPSPARSPAPSTVQTLGGEARGAGVGGRGAVQASARPGPARPRVRPFALTEETAQRGEVRGQGHRARKWESGLEPAP